MSTATVELDSLDTLAASMFSGYLVRKDLVRNYARQYSIPTYVVEFLLRRFCATVDEFDIAMGLQFVEQQLEDQTVKTGQEQIFTHRVREKGSVRLIDLVKAKSDTRNDCYIGLTAALGGLAVFKLKELLEARRQRGDKERLPLGIFLELEGRR